MEEMPMTPEQARSKLPALVWDDPFLLEEQLSEEERMIRDSARDYAREAASLFDALGARLRAASLRERFGLDRD